jgi:DNA-binding CsgD family transcriptional regulator
MTRRAKIKALLHLPTKDIARILDIDPLTVASERWRLNNRDRDRRNQRELARRQGSVPLDQRTCRSRLSDYSKVETLLSSGMTYLAIAKKLGVSRNTVAGIAYRIDKGSKGKRRSS